MNGVLSGRTMAEPRELAVLSVGRASIAVFLIVGVFLLAGVPQRGRMFFLSQQQPV